jgi:hypothetical protein
MNVIERFPYCDRNPALAGLELMPDLPVELRHEAHRLPCMGLVDSGGKISVLPYSLGVQLGLDWTAQSAHISLGGTLAHIRAWGIVVEAAVGQPAPVRLALAWAESDQVPFLLGQFNFFQAFDVCFFRASKVFEVRQPGARLGSG